VPRMSASERKTDLAASEAETTDLGVYALVEVRRSYRLFVEAAAARLITSCVMLMTRSG